MPWTMLFPWDNITDRENVRFECRGTEKSLSECTREVSQGCEGPVGIVCSNCKYGFSCQLFEMGAGERFWSKPVCRTLSTLWGVKVDFGRKYHIPAATEFFYISLFDLINLFI